MVKIDRSHFILGSYKWSSGMGDQTHLMAKMEESHQVSRIKFPDFPEFSSMDANQKPPMITKWSNLTLMWAHLPVEYT